MAAPQRTVASVLGMVCLTVPAATAFAQLSASSIAGVTKDSSGAVLPGVAVEAASPALIEKVRTAVTDEKGEYKIVDLRPGAYTVTFTLAGFSSVKREGIELTPNFTATVNAELKVGGLQETITVSGASPIVDIQNDATRNLIQREVLDEVPAGRTVGAFAALSPGMIAPPTGQDVGGSKGEQYIVATVHDSKEQLFLIDGLFTNFSAGRYFVPDPWAGQAVSVEMGGGGAETELGGIQMNFIGKDGGNRFSGDFFTDYSGGGLQGSNLTAALQARGLSAVNTVQQIYESQGALGGPIIRDRLWFFTSTRAWGATDTVAGDYYNATPQAFSYTPDFTQPALNNWINRNESLRLTWQASTKNKLVLTYNYQHRCDCHRGIDGTGTSGGNLPSNAAPLSPEATEQRRYIPNQLLQGTWTFPASNKLLFDAAAEATIEGWLASLEPGVAPGTIGMVELSTGLYYHGPWGLSNSYNRDLYARFNASYVTGSHAFKAGVAYIDQWSNSPTIISSNLDYQFRNGLPVSIIEYATPYTTYLNMPADLGLYAQDQWTVRRLTINAGLRFDYLRSTTPAQQVGATEFVPARSYAAITCVPCWRDLDPRVSAAYDLFGSGKTALKASLGRYVQLSNGLGVNPLTTSVNNVTRAWNDPAFPAGAIVSGNNPFPDCVLTNPAANGQCGPVSANTFGQPTITTQYSPAVLTGFEVRPYTWQFSTGLQQELRSGMAVNVAYYRTSWGNFTATDNLAIPPAGFSPYCVTLPVEPRLPGGGGNQVCGLYDPNPASFGQVNNLVTHASQFGSQTEVYNGADLTLRASLSHGGFVQGGLNTGRTETNNCYQNGRPDLTASGYVAGTPRTAAFCDARPPFLTQIKLYGAYPLPWNLQASGNFQSLPGIPITASYVASNAQILPSLGRNLSGNNSAVTLASVIAPGTLYEARVNQLDLRLTKMVKVRSRVRIQGMVDLYNVFNGSAILAENSRYGSAWLTPTQILDARLVKFGARVDF